MSTHNFMIAIFVVLLVPLFSGCKENTDISLVSGKVTYAGQPIKSGMVFFEPSNGQSQAYSVPIRDGRYKSTEKVAIKPGCYIVRVNAPDLSKSKPNKNAGPFENIPPEVPLLPTSWNKQSKLSVELGEGENIVNFSSDKMGLPLVEEVPIEK